MIASLKNKICHSVMARVMSVLIIFLSLFNIVNAKDIKVGFSPGYGNYSLSEIKEYQEQVYFFTRRQLTGMKMLDQFPDYFNFSAWLEIKVKRHSIGLNYTSLFTGARHTVSDYSGSYTFDMHLNAQRNSAYYKYYFYEKPGISPSLGFTYLKYGKTYSKLKVNEILEIYDLGENEVNYDYSAGGRFLEFGFGYVFQALRFLEYSITLGYDKDFSKEFKDVKKAGSFLLNFKGQQVAPNWSGIRLTVGINISIDE
jgi:hypothetical protein